MKLTLKKEYKSITLADKNDFESLDLPSFSVITGTNGSGKTHFLEAIDNTHISIDSNKVAILFNYNNFLLDNTVGENAHGDKRRPKKYNDVIGLFENDMFLGLIGHCNENTACELVDEFLNNGKSEKFHNLILKCIKQAGHPGRMPEGIQWFRYSFKVLEENNFIKDLKESGLPTQEFLHNYKMMSLSSLIGRSISNDYKIYLSDSYNARLKSKQFCSENTQNYQNPLKIFNDVLKKYSCNDFLFVENKKIKDAEPRDILSLGETTSEKFKKHLIQLKLVNPEGLEIDVEQLSSGEKTLLALSSFVYKNTYNRKLSGMYREDIVLLLDEIDTNLHPSMVKQMLEVIKDVFVGEYKYDVIMVTHSPTTIALAPEGSVFVMRRKNDVGKRLEQTTNEYAVNTLTEGFATLDKGIHLFDQVAREKISIITEGNNTQYIEKALSFYYEGDDIGILTGAEGRSGKNILKTLFQLFTRFNHNNKVIFVFDCDTAQEMSSLKDENNTYAFVFEKNEENDKVKKGIENLFPKERFLDEFYTQKPLDDGGQTEHLDKNCFMDFMLNDGTEQDFAKFRPLIDKINELKKG